MFFGILALPVLSLAKPIIESRGLAYGAAGCLGLATVFYLLYLMKQVGAWLLGGERSVTDESSSTLAPLAYSGFMIGLLILGPLAGVEYFTPPAGLLVTVVPPLQKLQVDFGINSSLPEAGDAELIAGETAGTSDQLHGDTSGPSIADFLPWSSASGSPEASSKLTAGEKSQALVAEGAGTTPQEALKDAFREAVQQVVGIVVDAETLIRDDELIKDKVLTYSDGFITKYEKLDETQRGGLVRIKISAVVERRSLVQKLKAANVTVKAFDGSGLFAEVVTQIEAKQNSEALIRKALADLPGLLTAEVDGKPDFNKETSEITVRVRVHVDQTAYSEFVKRLEDVLKKVCISHSSTLLKGEQDRLPWPMICEHHPALAGPAVKNNSQWGIWVNTFNSESHTSLRWNGYVVDCDPQAIVQSLEAPSVTEYHYSRGQISQDTITRASDAKTLLSIVALNANGKLVTEDQIELVCDQESTYRSDSSSEGPKPFLRHFYPRLLDDTGHVSNFRSTTVTQWLEQRNKNATVNLYIAPYSFTIKESGDDCSAIYQPQRVIERRIKVTLDELKAISHIQCKLSWNPAK